MINQSAHKEIKEYTELLKDIRWLKENMSKMYYPKEINTNELDKLESQIVKKLFDLISFLNK